MSTRDHRFFDSFMLALGIFVGVIAGLVFFVRMNAIEARDRFPLDDPEIQAAIAERIRPVGSVLLIGDPELEAAAATVAVVAPAPVDTVLTGAQTYNEACYLCHSAPGVGGAPVIGDSEAWLPRIEQGMEILNERSLAGYQGELGFMPAKGGRVDLSDAEVMSAVDYMIEQVPLGRIAPDRRSPLIQPAPGRRPSRTWRPRSSRHPGIAASAGWRTSARSDPQRNSC